MALEIEIEPEAVGLDSNRLLALDRCLARHVDDGRLPGWQVVVSRGGRVAHSTCYGRRDVAANLPTEPDTIYRIYSMTKPITSVAALMLWEQGAFDLSDPISRWLPEFAEMTIYGSDGNRRATEPIRIRHLLTHTAGLTYSFHRASPVDAAYRAAGLEEMTDTGLTLAEMTRRWATFPLLYEPGAEWVYSVATDVLGRLIEVISGQPLDEFLEQRIFTPLGLIDTRFTVDDARAPRLAQLYTARPDGFAKVGSAAKVARQQRWISGGGGLCSTAADYHRFSQFLLRRGELDGIRLLAPATVDRMAANQLPGGVDLETFGRPLFAEVPMNGIGYGFGVSVVIDPTATSLAASAGDYGWGGMASTTFTVDPALDLTMMFFTQLIPSSALPVRAELREFVHAAIL